MGFRGGLGLLPGAFGLCPNALQLVCLPFTPIAALQYEIVIQLPALGCFWYKACCYCCN